MECQGLDRLFPFADEAFGVSDVDVVFGWEGSYGGVEVGFFLDFIHNM